MKTYILTVLLVCGTARAEWYRVNSVPAYNTIKASRADGDKEPIVIRIRNLEKIEYIQPDAAKVLIGGEEAISLSRSVLQGQLVWVENLQPEEGAYVADVYPSFEQVMTVYKEKRIVNGDNISAEIKEKLKVIYKQMLADINLSPLSLETDSEALQTAREARDKILYIYVRMLSDIRFGIPRIQNTDQDDSGERKKRYESEFERTLFTADAIIWFREEGQYMHPAAQKSFADLLQSFQSDTSQEARHNQVRIEEIMEKQSLFKELFVNVADFERSKFTYTCLEWFKDRGQYLPADVQNVFIDWLRIYQRTNSTDGNFMKDRLQWMMDNNGLYQDFLELGN